MKTFPKRHVLLPLQQGAPLALTSEYRGSGFATSSITQYSTSRACAPGRHHVGTYGDSTVGPATSLGIGGMPGPGLSRDSEDEGRHADRPDKLQEMLQFGKLMTVHNELEPAMIGLRRKFKNCRAWNLDLQDSRTLVDTTLVKVNMMRDAIEKSNEAVAMEKWLPGNIKAWQEELSIVLEFLVPPLPSMLDREDGGVAIVEAATLSRHLVAVRELSAVRARRRLTSIQ